MSKLVSATVLPEPTIAGEIQVEFTWEKPDVRRADYGALARSFADNGQMTVPMKKITDTRCYASMELAQRAISNLQQEHKSA